MSDKKPVSLYVSSKATTQMHSDAASAVKQKMLARIEKDKERQARQKAKQEQQLAYRAEKKAIFRIAKDADTLTGVRCEDLEEALKLRGDAKDTIEGAESVLVTLKTKLKNASDRYYKAKTNMERLEVEILHADAALQEAKAPTDPSIIELKQSRLREAMTIANEAWDKVQKAIRKKDRNRSIRAWAKRLLK